MTRMMGPLLVLAVGLTSALGAWFGAHAALLQRAMFCSRWGGNVAATAFFGGLAVAAAGLLWLVAEIIGRRRAPQP